MSRKIRVRMNGGARALLQTKFNCASMISISKFNLPPRPLVMAPAARGFRFMRLEKVFPG